MKPTKKIGKIKKIPGLNKLENFAKKRIGSTDYKNASDIMRKILVEHVNTDIEEDIKKIKASTLIVWGTLDEAVDVERAYELEKLIKDAGVVVSGSPLQSVINVLLQGLSDEELNQGNLSLIPDGTKLRNISVSNGVATMDFSEEFMFNTFGNEGMLTQLRQVVYTATEFPTVKSVQFLINGKQQEFIAEGIYIGAPMARNSF